MLLKASLRSGWGVKEVGPSWSLKLSFHEIYVFAMGKHGLGLPCSVASCYVSWQKAVRVRAF